MPVRATTDEPVTEPVRVEQWRAHELARAGYDDYTAALLAACPEVNLHQAIDLIQGGCRQSMALKILL